ncbi:MAG: sugar phosphate nucleotidyltransferase [Bacteroidota bacterium]
MNRNQPQSTPSTRAHGGSVLPFEAIVMAGGRGERLSPLTDTIPKPLLKVGKRPIVEYSILRLHQAGVRDFTFCLNYRGEMIQQHFGTGKQWQAQFEYLYETQPLGTIGGAALKESFRFEDVLVINGDLLTTINFEKFYGFYLDKDADMAVATIPHRVSLAYGILEMDEHHEVHTIREKPTYTYHLNTGIYLMRRELLRLIPPGRRFDAVDLIQKAMEKGYRVRSFPLLDYWIDIGQMEDFKKAEEDVQFLDFG